MTSPLQVVNVIRARVANHLYVNKAPYVDPNNATPSTSRARVHYAWKPDRTEAQRIKRLSKGYVKPTPYASDKQNFGRVRV